MNKKRYIVIVEIVVAAVVLSILLYTMLANHQPVITSLAAEPERVPPLGNSQIACNASDRDSDELSYNWSASGGKITGEGAIVTWTAPYYAAGSYNVTAMVTDGRGGVVTKQVTITIDVCPTVYAANLELENVKTASLGYLAEHGYGPRTSDDLVPNYISGPLKAIYYFDTGCCGWVLNATPIATGCTGITFQPGVAGTNGYHGKWVKS